ncbi:MAG TPA: PQQ-dependent sugar dehydrogenase [Candidatus Paceibacterota bacterium]
MAYKKIIILIIPLAVLIAFLVWDKNVNEKASEPLENIIMVDKEESKKTPIPTVSTIATGLNIPWDIAFLPDDSLLITERPGNLVQFKNSQKNSIKLPRAVPKGEGGLLGITLHPQYNTNHFLYLYMTTSGTAGGSTKNAVFRYNFESGALSDEKEIIRDIPGAIYHDGGRMEFGPDGKLYITTGDATTAQIAQDKKSLGGKILRLNDDGSIPPDNPFSTEVWSYGHRNPQGLAWDNEGRLWETEHGRSGVTSGMDELNLIEKGKNYGWPDIEGDIVKAGMENPALHSGADDTWAPASAVYYKGSVFFGGLKGEALYEAVLDGVNVKELKTHFKNQFGRIRTVRLGPDNMLYITTSNRDGRGNPIAEDDRVIRINLEMI